MSQYPDFVCRDHELYNVLSKANDEELHWNELAQLTEKEPMVVLVPAETESESSPPQDGRK